MFRILPVQWKISVAELCRCNCPMQMQMPKLEFCQVMRINTFTKCAMKLFPKNISELIFKNLTIKKTKPQN